MTSPTDRQRVEMALPVLMLWTALRAGVDAERYPDDFARADAAFRAADDALWCDLPEARAHKLRRRVLRLHQSILDDHAREDVPIAKTAMIAVHLLQSCVAAGFLIVPEGGPLDTAVAAMLEALVEHVDTPLWASARKQARKTLARLQREHGLYQGVAFQEAA